MSATLGPTTVGASDAVRLAELNMTNIVLLVGLGAVLLLLVGLVAAAETAFTRVNRTRADAIAAADAEDQAETDDGPNERVEELRSYSRRPATTLASLALLAVVAQAAVVVVGWFVGINIGGRAGGYAGVGVASFAIFVAIATTRTRALFAPDATAVGLVPILRLATPLGVVTSLIVGLVRRSSAPQDPDPDVDEQQLLALVEEAAAIDPEEEALIKRVVAFDDQTVGGIMTPRGDVFTLRSGFAVQDALQVAALHGKSRIPVTTIEGGVDEIIGAVHVKDLMKAHLDGAGDRDIDLYMRHVAVVPEVQRAAKLLEYLKDGRVHLAIVADEHGGVAGLVTLEDILEELVGEIEDEFEYEDVIVFEIVDEGRLRVGGRCEIPRIEAAFDVDLAGEFRTVAGCVFNGLGRIPDEGDVLTLEDPSLELEVLEMQGRRIAHVEVRSNNRSQVRIVDDRESPRDSDDAAPDSAHDRVDDLLAPADQMAASAGSNPIDNATTDPAEPAAVNADRSSARASASATVGVAGLDEAETVSQDRP